MSEKKRTRQSYSAEFKEEAVRKCRESNANRVSKELGISVATLRNWLIRSESGPTENGKPSYEDLERENQRLRKELGYVNEINDILKKSTAIFSSSQMVGSR